LLTSASAATALAALAWPAAQDRLIYNRSPSVPVGFYLRVEANITRGAFVTVRAYDVAPEMARARSFDDPRNRFLKRVAALGGDSVCADGDVLRFNDRPAITRRAHDSAGAPLPRWNGCRTLAESEVLLLGDTADSFDGRYWGPIDKERIEGVWRPL
jgi:conjugative transfer signal peptidase TraF